MALSVAIIAGGSSHEAEVSRASAQEVHKALAQNHNVVTLELDPDLPGSLLRSRPDVVFPVLHGPVGEDGTIQGFLEVLDLPYVGSDVRGCALSMDKEVAKRQFQGADLPVADDIVLDIESIERAESEIRARLGNEVVIKPLHEGSALGVTLVKEGVSLSEALERAIPYGKRVLVERYLAGKEITVAVLDYQPSGARALDVIEIEVAPGEWYDYTNRYSAGKSRHVIPAPISAQMTKNVQDAALAAHKCLGLRDFSRADFIVSDDSFVILEVNAIPGMTPTSLLPDAAKHAGIPFVDLVDQLVQGAYERAR